MGFRLARMAEGAEMAEVNGRVTDRETGEPVFGASVGLNIFDYSDYVYLHIPITTTDVGGAYHFTNSGEHQSISIQKSSYKTQIQEVEAERGVRLDVELQSITAIAGSW